MKLPETDIGPTRYSLLSRLQDWEDADSWRDFFETYWRFIYLVAVRSGLTAAEAQDVVQETVICVAKEIKGFKRNPKAGSFKSWLFNLTRWRIGDQLRKRARPTRGGQTTDPGPLPQVLEEIPDERAADVAEIWESHWKLNLFEAALDRVKRQVKEEHYQIFDLYAMKGWPVAKISRMLKVSVGQVYIIKHRISALVKKEVKSLEKKHF